METKVKVTILGNYFVFLLIMFSLSILTASAKKTQSVQFVKEMSKCFVFGNNETHLVIDKKTCKLRLINSKNNQTYSEFEMPVFFVDNQWVYAKQITDMNLLSNQSVMLTMKTSNGLLLKLSVEEAGVTGFRLKYNNPEVQITNIKGTIKLNTVEEIYGFGENWNGRVAQRGQKIDIINKNGTPDECAWMPYFVSTNNYAFFINYGGLVKFDIGQSKSDELNYELSSGELELTILSGKSVASAISNFLSITGMPVKAPRWSFKPWYWLMNNPDNAQNKDSVKGEHVLNMVEKLKKLNMPIGVTWLEPFWQRERTDFTPHKKFHPDLKSLIKELDSQGIKTLAWTVPYTFPTALNWSEAVKNGYLVKKPENVIENNKIVISSSGELEGTYYNTIDFYNPKAVIWWQKQIEQAIDLGFKGFKLDDGQNVPLDGILHGGRIGKDYFNSYGHEYNRIFFETLKNKLGDDFLTVPRAAWIGTASKSNSKWPGDLSASFANNGLPSSIYSTLSLAMSGFSFVSTDIGGFEGRPATEDVFLRWAQFGAFLPGMQTLHMPWWYSEEAQDHYRFLSWLHTDLTPYWETLAKLAAKVGTPICKPLVLDYQDDINTWRIDNQFTVGEYILVAPIMNSEKNRDVYLPEGKWYNFWNDSIVYQGKQKLRVSLPKAKIKSKFPLLIKEGAIIPMEVENEISGFGSEYSKNYITLAIWPKSNGESQFVLNDKEGEVPVNVNWTDKKILKINWKNSKMDYLFRIHLMRAKSSLKVFANNNKLNEFRSLENFQESNIDGWYYDQVLQKIWIKKKNNSDSGSLSIHIEN